MEYVKVRYYFESKRLKDVLLSKEQTTVQASFKLAKNAHTRNLIQKCDHTIITLILKCHLIAMGRRPVANADRDGSTVLDLEYFSIQDRPPGVSDD
ncbi:hypothetical protein OUZ56_028030 [Daphnia magna]|uniref:Uncharacterized protein n=1 Tax=Daphnia magna TaxID=35525 RepID=A0ABR0B2N5_9CRUS|nr:hypothetical protein OUZ56_028030 [Daphnia magna]